MLKSERYNQCILCTMGSHITLIRERGRGGRERERGGKHGLIPGRNKTFSPLLSITLALGHTQPPIKWVSGTLIPGIKWQEH